MPDDILPPPLASGPTDPGLSPPGSFYFAKRRQQPRQMLLSARFSCCSGSLGSGRGELAMEPVGAMSVVVRSGGGGRSLGRGWRWPTGALIGACPDDFDENDGPVLWAYAGPPPARPATTIKAAVIRMIILPHHLTRLWCWAHCGRP